MANVRLGVLVSGSGTILEAIVASGIEIELVLADRNCRALEVARRANVQGVLLDRAHFGGFGPAFDRGGYTRAVTSALVEGDVDLVAMAGFGTVLTGEIHRAYPGLILNTHPSLLPQHKGWHAVARALEEGAGVTGCTVHVASEALDEGPILAQREVVVVDGDTEESLHERIKEVERRLYPEVITRVMARVARGEPVTTLEEA